LIPPALAALALALAAFRTYRLAAHDSLPPLERARNWAVGAHFHGARPPTFDRPLLADWLACAWCSGAWYSAAWYAAWLLWPRETLYAAAPLALSAAVGIAQAALPD
jgi:hypothetical protein